MKRALLISYHFPPSKAAGAVRWGSFTSAAPTHGWQFDVVTCEAGLPTAPSVLEEPGAVRIHPVRHRLHWILRAIQAWTSIRERLQRKVRKENAAANSTIEIAPQVARMNDLPSLFTPKGIRQAANVILRHLVYVPWRTDAASIGRALTRRHKYDAIISSGPPHLAADAARLVASASRVPLVLDFRDPWSTMDVLDAGSASVIYPWIARHYESRCIGAASISIANTPRAAAAIAGRYPKSRLITIPNGYDGFRITPNVTDNRFVAVYAGTIYLDRDPRPVFRALQECREGLGLSSENFSFRLIGEFDHFGGIPIRTIASSFGVEDLVEMHPPMPRLRLLEELASAAMLVNLPQGATLCIPSKIYEYVQFPAWILAIEPPNTATRDLLEPLGADVVPSDPKKIAEIFSMRVRQFRNGQRAIPLSSKRDFGYSALSSELFRALDSLASQPGKSPTNT